MCNYFLIITHLLTLAVFKNMFYFLFIKLYAIKPKIGKQINAKAHKYLFDLDKSEFLKTLGIIKTEINI